MNAHYDGDHIDFRGATVYGDAIAKQVNHHHMYETPARVPQSGYPHRVREIFPGVLRGREKELAELAAFCTAVEGPRYAWWQGEAWSGKSALMASFVLAPPPQVQVVSFFITARWAGQSDRAAFLEAVLPQLAQISEEPLPEVLTEARRQEWFLRLMDEAAQVCAGKGHRLLLLVDGLDEDRGVTTGPDAHSIAALLPASPLHEARVVVSGRPHPPVPPDVPHWHPLNDAHIIRQLSPSPAAQVARQEAERELIRLIDGGGLGRDLLGLLTASGGGLSARDLAELAETSEWEVGRVLRAVTGRTFTGRNSARQNEASRVFVLAHEELQQTALSCLDGELARWRDRLNAWAEGYLEQGWPAGTPEYLLRGYLRMLLDIGDLERMTALASDRARLDRMLDVSGGDATAMADITTVQEYIRDQPTPDLTSSLRLAFTRNHLAQRNSNVPTNLPSVWVALGNRARAEALAHSISDPGRQTMALALLVEAVAQAGDFDRAETLTHSITDPERRADALLVLTKVVAEAGDINRAKALAEQAVTLTCSITDSYDQARVLVSVVEAVAEAGDFDRAEIIARSIPSPHNVQALASLLEVVAEAGDIDRAMTLAEHARHLTRFATTFLDLDEDEVQEAEMHLVSVVEAVAEAGALSRAESIARTITHDFQQERALRAVMEAVARTGDFDRAENHTRAITNPYSQLPVLRAVAKAIAQAGDFNRAENITRCTTKPELQAYVLTDLVEVVAQAGDFNRAIALAEQAASLIRSAGYEEQAQANALVPLVEAVARAGNFDQAGAIARSITFDVPQSDALVSLVEAVVEAGDLSHAETLTRSITLPKWQARVLVSLAKAVARAGDFDRAETLTHSVVLPDDQADALVSLVGAVARAGDFSRAETLTRSIALPERQALALTVLAKAVARSGDINRARALAEQAETIARSIADPLAPFNQALLVEAVAKAGDIQRAETIARSITDPEQQSEALVSVMEATAKAGDINRAETLTHSITYPIQQGISLVSLVEAVAQTGDFDRAENIAYSIIRLERHMEALTVLAKAVANAGDINRAKALAEQAQDLTRSMQIPFLQIQARASIAEVMAQIGKLDLAKTVVEAINESGGPPRALISLVETIARAGYIEDAESIARSIRKPDLQALALAALALPMAEAGNFTSAMELTGEITSISRAEIFRREDEIMALVVDVMALAQGLDEAESIAHSIIDSYYREGALVSLVEAAVKAGDVDRAEILISYITEPEARSKAMMKFVKFSGASRARRLLGDFLVSMPPVHLLSTIAVIDPSAVVSSAKNNLTR